MSRSTISTFQLFQRFPDAESARLYLEGRLWPSGPICPECKSGERITARKAGFYRCNACPNDYTFTVRTGTIFERSHVPLHKWVYAMYLLITSRKGVSSLQMAKEIGVTQKTSWFMLQRLREACGSDPLSGGGKLGGDVEVDECFIGGKEANKHERKRLHAGRGGVGKMPPHHLQGVDRMRRPRVPAALDRITDVVLAYRPKPKTKAAKRRARKKKRDAAEG